MCSKGDIKGRAEEGTIGVRACLVQKGELELCLPLCVASRGLKQAEQSKLLTSAPGTEGMVYLR